MDGVNWTRDVEAAVLSLGSSITSFGRDANAEQDR